MKLFAIGVLVVISSACAGTGKPIVDPHDFEDVVDEGMKAIDMGDFARAYELAVPYAAAGNPDAQFTVGILVDAGHGKEGKLSTKKREKAALEWYRKAASGGHEEAIRHMSDAYERGWYGLEEDLATSQCWTDVLLKEKVPSEC